MNIERMIKEILIERVDDLMQANHTDYAFACEDSEELPVNHDRKLQPYYVMDDLEVLVKPFLARDPRHLLIV